MKPFFAGLFGTTAALTLNQWSDIASISAGASTVVYMLICSYKKLTKPNKNEK